MEADPGEDVLEAAARELVEETGLHLWPEPLGYRHTFAFGDTVPPVLFEESAFVARVSQDETLRLDPAEHVQAEWVGVAEALERLPFAGLRRAVQLATAGVPRPLRPATRDSIAG